MSFTVETSFGSMLELSWGGKRDVKLEHSPDGETRKFLEDGDTVHMTGTARGEGYNIGFGECIGQIIPAQTK